MVSKTSDDLPDPETPVTTVSRLCGIASDTSLRLWTRAPRMNMDSSKGVEGRPRQALLQLSRSGSRDVRKNIANSRAMYFVFPCDGHILIGPAPFHPRFAEQPRLHGHCGNGAGARNRRKYGDFF